MQSKSTVETIEMAQRNTRFKTIIIHLLFSSFMIPAAFGDFENELHNCMNNIMERYFNKTSVMVFDGRIPHNLTYRSLLPADETIQVDDSLRIMMGSEERVIEIIDKNHKTTKKNKFKIRKPQTSIFFFDDTTIADWQTIDPIFAKIKKREHWNRQGATLIVAQKVNPQLNNSVMAKNAIAATWRWNKAVNVVVMIAEQEEFYFYTWFPYREPDCHWVNPLPVLDTWRNGKFTYGQNLYPIKMKRDFEGCPFRVCSSDCIPYMSANFTKGFEAELALLLANYFNYSIVYVDLPNGEDMWTTINENGSIVGSFGQLNEQKADIAYACLMLNGERYNLAEALPTYFHDALTWFVPTPDLKSHASNIFEAFPAQYWIFIFSTTLAALLTFLLIHKLEEYALSGGPPQNLINASLRVFAIALSSPFTMASRNWLLRFMTFGFAIYSLHITTIYQASLYNLYKSNSYTNVYEKIEDAVDHGLFAWLRSSTKKMYNTEDAVWKKILVAGRHAYLKDDLETPFEQIAYKKTAMVLFIKTTMLTLIREFFTENRRPLMLFLPVNFASYPVTLFLSPGHPAFRKMSDLIHIVLSSGLIDYWLSQVVQFQFDELPKVGSNLSLQLEHISGAFMFYAALISISTGVFLIEHVYWLTHGRKVAAPMDWQERNKRKKLLFRAVVDLSRDRVTMRLGRFRST